MGIGGGGSGTGTATVAERKRKKKKGRPSLLDIEKRNLRLQKLRQQQQQPPPVGAPNPSGGGGGMGTRGRRREKKLKLVLALSPDEDRLAGSDGSDGSDGSAKTGRRNASSKTMDPSQGDPSDSGPTTSLPDKKLLEFILDRLQKKDTYGVFSEPVDPDELPDYHEIVDHPMDFGTIRKKLTDGIYANLEQFEKDVFLICSNAMQYNAPDTIFFRQARSIQELAKKDFENLRQESDDSEPQERIVRKGRPPSKNFVKKPVGRPSAERAGLNFSSEVTLATAADNACNSKSPNEQQPRRGFSSEKPSNVCWNNEKYNLPADLKNEKNEVFSGSVHRGITRANRNAIVPNDDRRSSYLETSGHRQEPSVLTIFDGERRQMMPVGLHVQHSYTRSLARFAANLRPDCWEIAAKMIKKALPPGTKFGRGWVGEKEEPHSNQLPLPLSSSITPSQTVISNKSWSRTVPPSTISPSVVDNSHIVRGSAEACRQPSYRNGFHQDNHGVQQQKDLRYQSSPISTTTNNVFTDEVKPTPFDETIPKPTMSTGSMHSQVPLTHAQVLNMVSRRDSDLFNYAIAGRMEFQRTKQDDLRAGTSVNGFAHPVATSHQEAETTTHFSSGIPSHYVHHEARNHFESDATRSADQKITTGNFSATQQTKSDYKNTTTNCESSMVYDTHISHGSLQGLPFHSKPNSDLNIMFNSPSISTSVPVIDCQYPDLALQL